MTNQNLTLMFILYEFYENCSDPLINFEQNCSRVEDLIFKCELIVSVDLLRNKRILFHVD